MSWESPIIRISTGLLNTCNDTVIANQAGITGVSKFGGQLGKALWVNADQISTMYSSSVGTLYGGGYRYVYLADLSPAPVVGQILWWSGVPSAWTVSTAIGLTDMMQPAGIYLGGMEPGNYGFIQFAGVATVKYTASLAVSAATGIPVIAVSTGLANTGNSASDPSILIGQAISLPSGSALGTVNLNNMLAMRN